MAIYRYTEERSNNDAEYMLEFVMRRQRWTYSIRDELAAFLREVAKREIEFSNEVIVINNDKAIAHFRNRLSHSFYAVDPDTGDVLKGKARTHVVNSVRPWRDKLWKGFKRMVHCVNATDLNGRTQVTCADQAYQPAFSDVIEHEPNTQQA